jgi:hypothetical protein
MRERLRGPRKIWTRIKTEQLKNQAPKGGQPHLAPKRQTRTERTARSRLAAAPPRAALRRPKRGRKAMASGHDLVESSNQVGDARETDHDARTDAVIAAVNATGRSVFQRNDLARQASDAGQRRQLANVAIGRATGHQRSGLGAGAWKRATALRQLVVQALQTDGLGFTTRAGSPPSPAVGLPPSACRPPKRGRESDGKQPSPGRKLGPGRQRRPGSPPATAKA